MGQRRRGMASLLRLMCVHCLVESDFPRMTWVWGVWDRVDSTQKTALNRDLV